MLGTQTVVAATKSRCTDAFGSLGGNARVCAQHLCQQYITRNQPPVLEALRLPWTVPPAAQQPCTNSANHNPATPTGPGLMARRLLFAVLPVAPGPCGGTRCAAAGIAQQTAPQTGSHEGRSPRSRLTLRPAARRKGKGQGGEQRAPEPRAATLLDLGSYKGSRTFISSRHL